MVGFPKGESINSLRIHSNFTGNPNEKDFKTSLHELNIIFVVSISKGKKWIGVIKVCKTQLRQSVKRDISISF